ncbi:hypothetical protein, partial [Marinobacter alexandrii]|uniref:hypothetical protein n=1 Tax=Marinobacter alexandrii TaxID=2570351 RepID=UPI003296968E
MERHIFNSDTDCYAAPRVDFRFNAFHIPVSLVAPLNSFKFELGGVLLGFLASLDYRHQCSPLAEL